MQYMGGGVSLSVYLYTYICRYVCLYVCLSLILGLLVASGWKSTKLQMTGHHGTASEAPFILRFAGGPMVARFGYWV